MSGNQYPLHKKKLPHLKKFLHSTKFLPLEKALIGSANTGRSDKKVKKPPVFIREIQLNLLKGFDDLRKATRCTAGLKSLPRLQAKSDVAMGVCKGGLFGNCQLVRQKHSPDQPRAGETPLRVTVSGELTLSEVHCSFDDSLRRVILIIEGIGSVLGAY